VSPFSLDGKAWEGRSSILLTPLESMGAIRLHEERKVVAVLPDKVSAGVVLHGGCKGTQTA